MFKFDENGRKLSKQVKNTVGKGEIACNEQFLLFPQCFQKACFQGASKGVVVWEWVKPLPTYSIKRMKLTFNMIPKTIAFENIVNKSFVVHSDAYTPI